MLNIMRYVHPLLYFTVLCLKADNIVLRNQIEKKKKQHIFVLLFVFDALEQQLSLSKGFFNQHFKLVLDTEVLQYAV